MASNKDIIKLMEEQQKSKITCPCGHRVLISTRKDRMICSWCKNYVYKDKATEFRYKMRENVLRERRK